MEDVQLIIQNLHSLLLFFDIVLIHIKKFRFLKEENLLIVYADDGF